MNGKPPPDSGGNKETQVEENTFWIAVWRAAAAAFCVFVLTVAGCVSFGNQRITDMVKSGADPIKAKCAITGAGNSDASMCAIAATK